MAERLAKTVLIAALLSGAAAHGDSASVIGDEMAGQPDLAPMIADLLAVHAANSTLQFAELSAKELAALAGGEPLVSFAKDRHDDPKAKTRGLGLLGLTVVDVPRELIWLSLLDITTDYEDELTYATLESRGAGAYVRYQHVQLPWPFRDRHWVIDCTKNVPLATNTDGRIWEHRWTLEEGGEERMFEAHEAGEIPSRLTRRMMKKSVYLPFNRGAWTLFELNENQTLVAAFLDVNLGGTFPSGLVRGYARKQLRKGLVRLAEFSGEAAGKYDEKPLVYDGFGDPLTLDEIGEVTERWSPPVEFAASEQAD